MPLEIGPSKNAFNHNVAVETKAKEKKYGKKKANQIAVAIAFSEKRKQKPR